MSIRVQLVTDQFNPISASIRLTTRSWASHAEFVDTEAKTTLGARSNGGVAIRPCSGDHYSRVEQFTAPGIVEAYEWAKTQVGKPYDYSAIVGILTDRDIHDESKWFCSELVHVAFEKPMAPLLSTRPSSMPWRVTPRDLLLSRQLIYVTRAG